MTHLPLTEAARLAMWEETFCSQQVCACFGHFLTAKEREDRYNCIELILKRSSSVPDVRRRDITTEELRDFLTIVRVGRTIFADYGYHPNGFIEPRLAELAGRALRMEYIPTAAFRLEVGAYATA